MQMEDNGREAVVDRLGPHLPALEACFRQAWNRWQTWLKTLEGSPADVTARSRASVLYDFIAAEAIKAFIKTDGIRVRRERGFLVLRFQDRVALRFKKFRNKNLGTSMNNTAQTELFNGQMLEFAPGALQPMTHVVAGYLLDGLAMDISQLAITCTCNGEHLWAPIEIVLNKGAAPVSLPGATELMPKPVVRSAKKRQVPAGTQTT